MTAAVLDDWRTAPVSEPLRATLGFLEKLTLRPDEVQPADAERVRAAGVRDEALSDAIHVCVLFNVIDRMADALDAELPTPAQFAKVAPFLLKHGYGK